MLIRYLHGVEDGRHLSTRASSEAWQDFYATLIDWGLVEKPFGLSQVAAKLDLQAHSSLLNACDKCATLLHYLVYPEMACFKLSSLPNFVEGMPHPCHRGLL